MQEEIVNTGENSMRSTQVEKCRNSDQETGGIIRAFAERSHRALKKTTDAGEAYPANLGLKDRFGIIDQGGTVFQISPQFFFSLHVQ